MTLIKRSAQTLICPSPLIEHFKYFLKCNLFKHYILYYMYTYEQNLRRLGVIHYRIIETFFHNREVCFCYTLISLIFFDRLGLEHRLTNSLP